MEKCMMDKECNNFCYNVSWLRKHHGLSKKQMAKLMEIGTGSVTKLEKGIFPPRMSINVVMLIYRHFGIRPSAQFTDRLGE